MRRLHDRTGFGVALVRSKLAARLDGERWGTVPQRQIEEDFPTIHSKEVFAASILRHSVCTRKFVGYDGVDGGLARSAVDKLKRAYIPEAPSYARKRLVMLEKQVAAIEQHRGLGKGGGAGGGAGGGGSGGGGTGGGGGGSGGSGGGDGSGGGGGKKPTPPLERHGGVLLVPELQVRALEALVAAVLGLRQHGILLARRQVKVLARRGGGGGHGGLKLSP